MGKSSLETSDSLFYKPVIAGSLSGMAVRFVISPLDVVKIRLQLERNMKNNQSTTATNVIKSILRKEGALAFWKGNLPAEIMYLLYGGTQFSAYSFVKNTAMKDSGIPKDFQSLICGGLSGCTATIVSYPFDTLRTRLAADKHKGFNHILKVIDDIRTKESARGFYQGLKPTIYQVFILTGLSFWTYNRLREFQQEYEKINDKDSMIIPISGFIAGCFSKAAVFPLDSVKRRLQVRGSSSLTKQNEYRHLAAQKDVYNSKNIWKIWTRIVQTEGLIGLYRGCGIAIIKSGPASSLSFTFYEFFMRYLT
ncbi:thiamine transporter [Saccharomycopsis crataegensis]|uniref:Thiamine transporter n=1 Tax=Saccharomycopsis crataegensis TaxID=43959 RepID=A0AAV5QFG5_9ASCO|nr:thiamine transporter [Saccharomycopsis crataegensis]